MGRVIRESIVRLGEKTSTSVRSLTDDFLPCIADVERRRPFPFAIRRHPVNPDRATSGGVVSLLCFNIGNAIMLLHEAWLTPETDRARLTQQVDLLRRLSEANPIGFTVEGSIADGFQLVP